MHYTCFFFQEPAKYEFEYEVNAPEFGTQFGHKESRDGDVAVGEYNVLLPDGRKQIVQYTADTEGYKPKISYEGTRALILLSVFTYDS